MTRLCNEHGGINLAQGFPDSDPPRALLDAAKRALDGGKNQYAITWGAPSFRRALADKIASHNGVTYEPDRHLTVTCGATEAMMATMLAIIDPGDEVVVFEPFYENYGPDAVMSGATLRFVPLDLRRPEIPFDREALRAAFGPRTRAIIVNTPHNPSGKVFTRDELGFIAELCERHDALAITDEVYEHILYDGARHVSLASLPGMAERTVVINSMSKTFSVTGWRVGWAAVRDAEIVTAIRRAHDFLTVGAAAPLQEAGVVAMAFPKSYYDEMAASYAVKRDRMLGILRGVGLQVVTPRGSYYIMTEFAGFGFDDDVSFARHLVTDIGVATVPGSSFFQNGGAGRRYVRFAFPKREETLRAAEERLSRLQPRG
ncbi:MAG: aminotransferase class I/II-fold pyridoxal phosphate-dependent enzyme [Armatimonadetes bacterium]|nr:aminotransferase class I/II-fold pyridoxal phosphate-dependent enzyme [Armatimonadota bacterium]